MKLGGFNRAERVSKINRLIEIENYLSEKDQLVSLSDFNGDTKFITDLDIPEEHAEAIQVYRQTMDRAGSMNKK